MKKMIFSLVLIGTLQLVNAQEVGFRFGETLGLGVAIDGVFSVGEMSRVHADLSFGNSGMATEVLYDFINKPTKLEELNWYVGVGPSMFIGDEFVFGVCGEIGLEYRFEEVPIVLGIDWRPNFEILEDTSFDADEFGINIRYVFGK